MYIDFEKEFKITLKEMFPKGPDWDLVGILMNTTEVYTLSYDSKILSGIFEILIEPVVSEICQKFNLTLIKGVQNQYPEFTIFSEDAPNEKIAIDVKSTYRKFKKDGGLKKFGYTLGSYRSYLRDGKRGIAFPYNQYVKHWIIGFLYTRNEKCKNVEIRKITEASTLEAPYTDIEFFIQEKYKIAGLKPGSGNTTNIGSIKSDKIEDFDNGELGFKSKKDFVDYWSTYTKT